MTLVRELVTDGRMSVEWNGLGSRPAPPSGARRQVRARLGPHMERLLVSRTLVGTVGFATALGVSLVVCNIAGPARVRVPELAGPSYAQDVTGFRPVTRRLLRELASARKGGVTLARAVPVAAVQRTATTTAAKPPSGPAPKIAPEPSPQPSLAIGMFVDHTNVHPNDVVVYTIRVVNGGPGTARGVVVESHVPDGTTLKAWECDGRRVATNGAASFTCGAPAGQPNHPIVFAVGDVAPGSAVTETFWVRVDHGVVHDSAIADHAHVYANGVDLIDSEPVSVIV